MKKTDSAPAKPSTAVQILDVFSVSCSENNLFPVGLCVTSAIPFFFAEVNDPGLFNLSFLLWAFHVFDHVCCPSLYLCSCYILSVTGCPRNWQSWRHRTLYVYSRGSGISALLSLTLSPKINLIFRRHCVAFIHGNSYSGCEIFWMLHANLSCILRLYPSLEDVFGIISLKIYFVSYCEFLLTFYWPVAQHSGFFL